MPRQCPRPLRSPRPLCSYHAILELTVQRTVEMTVFKLTNGVNVGHGLPISGSRQDPDLPVWQANDGHFTWIFTYRRISQHRCRSGASHVKQSGQCTTSRRFSQEAKNDTNDTFGTTGERNRLRPRVQSQSLSASKEVVITHATTATANTAQKEAQHLRHTIKVKNQKNRKQANKVTASADEQFAQRNESESNKIGFRCRCGQPIPSGYGGSCAEISAASSPHSPPV